jgi:succinyl-diaminopimelate desuccinylase
MYKEQISSYIDSYRQEMKNTLRELVAVPSYRQPEEENMPYGKSLSEILAKVLNICDKMGLTVRNFDNYVGTADYFSDKSIEPELGILFHLDVVPEGAGWSYPPFELTELNGRLIGRGTIDDKGPAVSVLYAVKAIKELNIPLKKNFRLIMGCDEENGSGDLAYYCTKEKLPDKVFTPDGSYPVLNIEKGMIRSVISKSFSANSCKKRISSIKGGLAVNAVPETASACLKGFTLEEVNSFIDSFSSTVKFTVNSGSDCVMLNANGRSAHASTPELGDNALTAMLALLSSMPFDECDIHNSIKALSELFPYGEMNGKSCQINCSDEKSGELTLVLSVLELYENNMTAKTDIRFPINKASDEIIQLYKKAVQKHGFTLQISLKEEPHYVDENSSFIQTLLGVYEDMTGKNGYCVAIGGLTYVHDTPGGVAFGVEYEGSSHNMHGADEFIYEEELLLNAKIFAEAIIRLCS